MRKRFENHQRPRHDAIPPLPQTDRNQLPVDLQQLAQREQTQFLVVHPRQLVLGVDRREPRVEKGTGSARFVGLHEVQSGGGVVKHRVDENDEVGEFKGVGVAIVDVVDSDLDDILEVLTRGKGVS